MRHGVRFTSEEMGVLEHTLKTEWQKILQTPDELETWVAKAGVSKYRDAGNGTDDGDVDGSFRGLWGASDDSRFMFDPDAMSRVNASFEQGGDDIGRKNKRHIDEADAIRRPVPDRMGGVVDNGHMIHGCAFNKHNVCLVHSGMPADRVARVTAMYRLLYTWVDSLSATALDLCTGLLWLRNTSPGKPSKADSIVVLQDQFVQPKVQYFGYCRFLLHNGTAAEPIRFQFLGSLPFVCVMSCINSPMGGANV